MSEVEPNHSRSKFQENWLSEKANKMVGFLYRKAELIALLISGTVGLDKPIFGVTCSTYSCFLHKV